MATTDVVREKVLSLAEAGTSTEESVREVLECCREKRVPVVLARQQFLKELEERPSDPVVSRAAHLLDRVLERLPLA
jgi:chorismate-pyruvate lyase